ncbi:MAG: hypothetical protein LKE54_04565 [Prevotella sp.]|jgi:hypothetical protein|nr:hypothetical protein [Prevotella sp.]MCH3994316.1 hypothetical protein [Prevotella sp.]
MKYLKLSHDKLEKAISDAGMSEREFVKKYYGKSTHGTLEGIVGADFRISKLIKICNLLNVDMDNLFDSLESSGSIPRFVGNNNNVNSTVIKNDNTALRSENKALRLIIEEKDKRISDLSKTLDYLIKLNQAGQNSDNHK